MWGNWASPGGGLARGHSQPWWARPWGSHMKQFKADMGLVWTGIRVRKSNNRPNKPLFDIFFTVEDKKDTCLLCVGQ